MKWPEVNQLVFGEGSQRNEGGGEIGIGDAAGLTIPSRRDRLSFIIVEKLTKPLRDTEKATIGPKASSGKPRWHFPLHR